MSRLEGLLISLLQQQPQQESDGRRGLPADSWQQSSQATGDVDASMVSILQMRKQRVKTVNAFPKVSEVAIRRAE